MSPRALKIGLMVSAVLNLFLVGLIVGGLILTQNRFGWNGHGPEGHGPAGLLTKVDMSDIERDTLRATFEDAALKARPDFKEAKSYRNRAADLAGEVNYDSLAIAGALEKARLAEIRGRTIMEADIVAAVGKLPAETRKRLSKVIFRRPPGMMRQAFKAKAEFKFGDRPGSEGQGPAPQMASPDHRGLSETKDTPAIEAGSVKKP